MPNTTVLVTTKSGDNPAAHGEIEECKLAECLPAQLTGFVWLAS